MKRKGIARPEERGIAGADAEAAQRVDPDAGAGAAPAKGIDPGASAPPARDADAGHLRLTVDGRDVAVPEGATLLDATRAAGRWVPTLCFDERQAPFGACRVCLVGVEGAPTPLPACTTLVRNGMVVATEDETARRVAAAVIELVLSELPEPPAPHTELAQVAAALDVGTPRWPGTTHPVVHENDHPYLAFRHELCISCGRCVRACDEVQGTFALTATGRGFDANVAAGIDEGFRHSACVSCGACADTCPTEAIGEPLLLALAGGAPAATPDDLPSTRRRRR